MINQAEEFSKQKEQLVQSLYQEQALCSQKKQIKTVS